jgi:hypothetical protein
MSFNLTSGQKKIIAVNKNKIWKLKFGFWLVMQQGPPLLMARFQPNIIFEIYRGVMQRKNMNMDKRTYR